MTKILITGKFGAGWTTWHSGPYDELVFMLTAPILIEALETPHDGGHSTGPVPDVLKVMKSFGVGDMLSEYDLHEMPYNILLAIPEFLSEWTGRFPNKKIPCLGGIGALRIVNVDWDPQSERYTKVFAIRDYDGKEKIRYIGRT